MEKKYVATIMERHFISVDNYVFVCRNTVVGDYDEESKIFTDVNGNEYMYMISEDALTMDVPFSIFNVIDMDELKAKVKLDAPIDDLIGEYGDLCKKLLYYVGYTEDYVPFLYAINIDNLKKSAISVAKGEVEDTQDGEMSKGLGKLIIDALDDKYSKKELESIIDNLKMLEDDIENTVGTLETKVEAIESNKTFSECLREKLDNPMDVVKPKQKKTTKIVPKEEKKTKTEPKKKEELLEIKETKKEEKTAKIDIEKLFEEVTKVLVAQDDAARRVITEIARKEVMPRKKREGILLTGPTGVGKTEMMRQISKNINKAFIKIDSTQLTVPGYVGKDIEEALWDLYVQCGKDLEKTEHAIVFFDEIDKKGSEKKNEVNGRGVLNVLLPFIEGSTYDAAPDSKSSTAKVKIDTSNMTVILGGAFTDVYKNLTEKNQIGFDTEKNSLSTPKYRKAETKDFVEHGLMTDEFMGRVTVVRLNDLDVESIKRIMLESDESAIKAQEEAFKKLGVKITFTNGFIDKVATIAFNKKTGARGLNGVIDESTWKAFEEMNKYYCDDTIENPYREVRITEDTIEDSSNYQLVKKRTRKK